MTEYHYGSDPALNGPDPEDKRAQLRGVEQEQDHEAYIDPSDVDSLKRVTRTTIDEGSHEAFMGPPPADDDSLDLLTSQELRAGETDDPIEAIQEGYTYVPPTDPPTVVSQDLDDAMVASGFGGSALDDEYDADGHRSFLPADDEISARVREALLADSMTSQYARAIGIETRDSVVYLRGWVSDLTDSDAIVEVASRVSGISEVIDELKISGIDDDGGTQ